MKETEKEDLRVIRTKEAIRKAFEEMICEMDYEGISVKELSERARINRKTFYLHYNSIDDLLREMQSDMAKDFVSRTRSFRRPEDMDKITREFYAVSESKGNLYEKLMCNGNYRYIRKQITNEIMGKTWEADGKQAETDPFVQNIIITFVAQGTIEIYKQWVSDGKKIPVKEIADLTTRLICEGLGGVFPAVKKRKK